MHVLNPQQHYVEEDMTMSMHKKKLQEYQKIVECIVVYKEHIKYNNQQEMVIIDHQ